MGTRKKATTDVKVQQGKQRDAYFARIRQVDAARARRLARTRPAATASQA